MLPLGGPEFWLQAELQDAWTASSRPASATSSRCRARRIPARAQRPHDVQRRPLLSGHGQIRIATLYHRDHGIDATLLVLKHELAHWAARWRYGRRIAPHGREFRMVAKQLDPRITITCPPFAHKERAQRRRWRMMCPHCRRTYRRAGATRSRAAPAAMPMPAASTTAASGSSSSSRAE